VALRHGPKRFESGGRVAASEGSGALLEPCVVSEGVPRVQRQERVQGREGLLVSALARGELGLGERFEGGVQRVGAAVFLEQGLEFDGIVGYVGRRVLTGGLRPGHGSVKLAAIKVQAAEFVAGPIGQVAPPGVVGEAGEQDASAVE